MGGFAFYGPYGDESLNIDESLFEISTNPRNTVEAPDSATLIYIMEHFPHIITDITEEYILDRAESSGLSKALLIFQVGWFCTNSPWSLEKRASQALISHVDLPPERGSDGPSTVNICQPVNSDADSRHLPVTLPVLNLVAHPARSWAPLRRFFCSDVSCMPYR